MLSFGSNPLLYLPPMTGSPQDEPLELEIRLKLDLEFGAVQEVAQKVADLQRDRTDWENKRKLELAELEKERSKPAQLSSDREQQLIRKHEEAKLALQQKHEQTTRALVQQHEETKMSLRKQHEDTLQQHEESKKAIVEQFEQAREELEKRLAQAEEQLEQQRKANAATIAEHEKAQATFELNTQELAIARGNVEELKAEIERLTTVHAQTQTDLVDARKVNSRLASALDQERLMRAMMENTRSWQMTKPLRNMVGLFKPTPKE
jgi:chromosome segregation ATPase